MAHMDYAQIEITNNYHTDTAYASCGHDQCNAKILAGLGVGNERFTHADTFNLSDDENTITVVVQRHLDERDSCAWCYGCGDFLVHGLSCTCEEEGHDPEEDREPLLPMVVVNGSLELRPFKW